MHSGAVPPSLQCRADHGWHRTKNHLAVAGWFFCYNKAIGGDVMFLYRMEAKGKGFPDSIVVVLAESEEAAFKEADGLLEKNAVGLIEVGDIAIVEKKRVEAGNG